MAEVELRGVSRRFPNGFQALHDLSLTVADGEFLVLVGPSGCGKSTALNIVAGLEACTTGDVRVGDRVVTHEPPKRRDVAMVFQDYALYPHMTVARNIGFPLELAKVRSRRSGRGLPRRRTSSTSKRSSARSQDSSLVGQKHTPQLGAAASLDVIGFDFVIAEECGFYDECPAYTEVFGANVIAIEYTEEGFAAACDVVGDEVSVVVRDVDVTTPDSETYVYDTC
jgi:ABC-type sugar transport system ATPase subunit